MTPIESARAFLAAHPMTQRQAWMFYVHADAAEIVAELIVAAANEAKSPAFVPFVSVPGRCDLCDWTLCDDTRDGCTPGNCSYRPSEHHPDANKLAARREWIAETKRRAAGLTPHGCGR